MNNIVELTEFLGGGYAHSITLTSGAVAVFHNKVLYTDSPAFMKDGDTGTLFIKPLTECPAILRKVLEVPFRGKP
jgi:hypothetical protein